MCLVKISKHDDDNEAITVKGPCSASVIYKHEEKYQESVVHKNGDKRHLPTIQGEGIA